MSQRFQVDLRGVVDLLGRHLYSSPRVYLRELAQNGVDAVVARQGREPDDDRPAVQLVVHPDGVLECWDSGVGLSREDIDTFLSTIGSSSKRDQLGMQREDLLGQFGIGLLSAFMVSDTVEVLSSRGTGRRRSLVRWVGSADGTYTTSVPDRRAPADPAQAAWLARGPGTCVRLVGRPGERWTTPQRVVELARDYLSYLPHRVVVRLPDDTVREIAPTTPPWAPGASGGAAAELGTTAFATLAVEVPEAAARGVVVVEEHPRAARAADHVYVRGMLVTRRGDLSPAWAPFCRAVLDAGRLRPTASREGLYDDDLTAAVREGIAEQVTRWLRRLARTDPPRMTAFLDRHAVGLCAAALHDRELRALLVPLLPLESSEGTTVLGDLAPGAALPSYVATVDDFRQVAPLARAQGLVVINAGHVHEAELLRTWATDPGGLDLPEITPRDLEVLLDHLDDDTAARCAGSVAVAEEALRDLDVAVHLRRWAPTTMPALLLDDPASWRARDRERSRRRALDAQDDAFGALLASSEPLDPRPRLLLNHHAVQVRRVLDLRDPDQVGLAARALYVRALLATGRPVRPADAAVVDSTFGRLLDLLTDP